MTIRVALHHLTRYTFDRRISLSPHEVRLRPAPHCRTPILSYALSIEPAGHFINWQQDPFSNYLARLVVPDPVTEFKVTVDLVAEMAVYNPFDFFLTPEAEEFPFTYDDALAAELAPYLVKREMAPHFAAFVASIDRTPRRTIDFLVELNQRLQQDIRYLIRMEPGVQTPEVTTLIEMKRESLFLAVRPEEGNPAVAHGINVVGLRRAGVSAAGRTGGLDVGTIAAVLFGTVPDGGAGPWDRGA